MLQTLWSFISKKNLQARFLPCHFFSTRRTNLIQSAFCFPDLGLPFAYPKQCCTTHTKFLELLKVNMKPFKTPKRLKRSESNPFQSSFEWLHWLWGTLTVFLWLVQHCFVYVKGNLRSGKHNARWIKSVRRVEIWVLELSRKPTIQILVEILI